MEEKKKSNKKTALIIILGFIACVVIYNLYEDHRRQEALREMNQRNREMMHYHDNYGGYQPSFGGRQQDRLEEGIRECSGSPSCRCKVTKSSLLKAGYSRCPYCNHTPSYHQ